MHVEKKKAFARLGALIVLAINQLLVILGWEPFPYTFEQIYEFFSWLSTISMAIYTWYKNNNVTKEAIEAQMFLNKNKNKQGGV